MLLLFTSPTTLCVVPVTCIGLSTPVPKPATLLPETATLSPETGDFVAVSATKSPVSETGVAAHTGDKVAENQNGASVERP